MVFSRIFFHNKNLLNQKLYFYISNIFDNL